MDVRSGQPYSAEQLVFCQSLPKIELHAHLNGSLRDSTIRCAELQCPIFRDAVSRNAITITIIIMCRELALKRSIDPELVKLTSKGVGDRHAKCKQCLEESL